MQDETLPPTLSDAIRERTVGEKHAYLDGFQAGVRQMMKYTSEPLPLYAHLFLENADVIRDTLPPR